MAIRPRILLGVLALIAVGKTQDTTGACATSPCQNGGVCYLSNNNYICMCPSGFEGQDCNDPAGGNCGTSHFGMSSGTITSPNYPATYPNNRICYYYIKIPNARMITLTFDAFNTELLKDVLDVYIGPSTAGTSFMAYEGNYTTNTGGVPDDIVAMTDQISFFFTTDRNVQLGGWSISWASACATSPCQNGGVCYLSNNNYICMCPSGFEGQDCTDSAFGNCGTSHFGMSSGTITSPNYPATYPNNRICYYYIKIPNARMITLTFDAFNTELIKDVLDVYIGPSTTGTIFMSYQGNYTTNTGGVPDDIVAMTDQISFFFTTDRNVQLGGWSISWASDGNQCESNPCLNGATCIDLQNAYQCVCAAGYEGTGCETDINECASSPCRFGAACNNLINLYTCACQPGYIGTNCEMD
ncbi:fibropellin-1-like [Patiria miniata]|uniref:Uncharacterized protein n=1 Tax=Patiria miniata TaxID=46514 RepID=A0A913ZM27_PATMI|nr:fibropellin-1-like [Patiria miniata]